MVAGGRGNIREKDPESRFTGGGMQIAHFSVAVNKYTGKGDDRKQETTWVYHRLLETA